jgi:hypothetical protein
MYVLHVKGIVEEMLGMYGEDWEVEASRVRRDLGAVEELLLVGGIEENCEGPTIKSETSLSEAPKERENS